MIFTRRRAIGIAASAAWTGMLWRGARSFGAERAKRPLASTPPGKTKIVVLGGGPAAMAAVYGLTSAPDAQKRFDITVIQMGWRLGGKCASSRLPARRYEDREHGFHILGGFYHNSLKMLRHCYDEWSTTSPHPTFDQAFLPQNLIHLMQQINGKWDPVIVPFPTNDMKFGCGETSLSPFDMAAAIWRWFHQTLQQGHTPELGVRNETVRLLIGQLDSLVPPRDPIVFPPEQVQRVVDLLTELIATIYIVETRPQLVLEGAFDYAMMIKIGLVVFRGIMADFVWLFGFDHINDIEFSDWLAKHGAKDDVINSRYIRAGYDYAFAYEGGDPGKRTFAAGAGLRGTLRLLFTYHDTVFAHMDGGMGEVVFTPLYQVLKARGVKFRFFHRVDRLELDSGGTSIQRVHGTRQAAPKGGEENYEPLITYEDGAGSIGTRQFWPPCPIYDQLSDVLKREEDPDLAEEVYESPWWPGGQPFVLEKDVDFDHVINAISLGALPDICQDLAARFPVWHDLFLSQETVQTISMQLWFGPTIKQLGWSGGPTVMTAFAEPFATWADMSFLLNLEQPATPPLEQLSYFCGTMTRSPGPQDINYPAKERARAWETAGEWLKSDLRILMPEASTPPDLGVGPLGDKYVRANSLPSQGYVLSRPRTIDKRIRVNESGVDNLFLAGDWTRNGADTGSFENAVMSGLQCSRAICGFPMHISGETDFS